MRDADKFLENSVADIKKDFSGEYDVDTLIELERSGKNRKTLIRWLERKQKQRRDTWRYGFVPDRTFERHLEPDGRWIRFGLTGDTHLVNNYHDNEAWRSYVADLYREGITVMFHAGDLWDGCTPESIIYRGQQMDVPTIHYPTAMKMVSDGTPDLGVKKTFICLSDDTLIFTKRGWLSYNEITIDDKVLSIKDGLSVEWNNIKKINKYHHKGKMINIFSSLQDQLLTPEHDVLYIPYQKKPKKIKLIKAKEIMKMKSIKIPISGKILKEDNPSISDDLIKILAWIITEGTFLKNGNRKNKEVKRGIQIYQNKDRYFDEIKKILKRLDFKFSVYSGKKENHKVFYIWKQDAKKIYKWLTEKLDISKLLFILSERQLKLFMKELMKGDGTWQSKKSGEFYTSDLNLAKQLVGLLSMIGWRSRINTRKRYIFGKKWIHYIIAFRASPKIQVSTNSAGKFKEVDYDGIVFDLTTEKGNFLAMRNGKPFFTGNSGNHDTKLYEMTGVDAGEGMQRRREKDGHDDFDYLQPYYARVELSKNPRLLLDLVHLRRHPAYSLGYALQTYLRNVPPRMRSHILGAGHTHKKMWAAIEDETQGFLVGGFQKANSYVIRQRKGSVRGGWIVEVRLATNSPLPYDKMRAEFLECGR